MPLPPCEEKKTLAYQFNSFFIMKIEKIMEGLVPTDTHLVNPVYLESEMEITVILHEFSPITLDETNTLILSVAPKSCELDLIPTKLLRNHIDVLTPTIQKIINISITNGTISTSMKEALLRLLLKTFKYWINSSLKNLGQFPIYHLCLSWLRGLYVISCWNM